MQSPSFESRRKTLAALFSRAALRNTWRNKVRYALRDRIMPDPLSHMDFHINLSRNVERAISLVTSGKYRPHSPTRLLMEKSRGLCRQIVLPTAQDALILQRLSDRFFSAIRGKTPSKAAYFEPDNFTFDASGKRSSGYGSLAAWLHFQRNLKRICASNEYLVISDIANYYDHIGHSALRNIVSSNVEADETVFDLLLHILNSMNWSPDYLPSSQMGLPQIDLDAPRILAHSFLFDLDRYAERVSTGRFTRYMDDINFGTQSAWHAKKIVRDVDLLLHARQVRLNSGKTFILKSTEAYRFFRFEEHQRLDLYQKALEVTPKNSEPYQKAAVSLSKLIRSGYWRGHFDAGHGEKVLKRAIGLSRISGRTIPSTIVTDILRNRPSCREAVLAYLTTSPHPKSNISILTDFLRSPDNIDDVAPLLTSSKLVEMQVLKSRTALQHILPAAEHLEKGGPNRLYAALWLLSKYGTGRQILDILQNSIDDWTSHYELGRLAGGLFPIFYATKYFDEYRSVIQGSLSQPSGSAYQFYFQLINQPRVSSSLQRFLLARNVSLPNKLNHQKFLMILATLKSPTVSDEIKERLLRVHHVAWSDIFYRRKVLRAVPQPLADLI